MRLCKSRRQRLTRSFLLLGCALAATVHAAVPDRIAGVPDPRAVALLQGSLHPLAQTGHESGRLDGDRVLHGVSLYFRLSEAQRTDLDELLRQQQDLLSPNYRAWLSPAQYASRFGLSAADQGKIRNWLRGQGLSVDDSAASGNRIRFSASVARIESAFHTELHHYQIDGESHFANAGELSVPAALSGIVLGVRGLDDFRPKPRLQRAAPQFTSLVSGNHFLVPDDVATIYDLKPLYAAGVNGSGRKIAVVGQTSVNLSDIRAFRTAAGLPALDPLLVLVPNTGAATLKNGSDDMAESDIDIEWTGGLAPSATIEFVYAGSNGDIFDALTYAVEQNLAPVISTSYGACEPNNTTVIGTGIFQQANAQGQTVMASSGDAGAADCDMTGGATASNGLAVDFPASSPNVTGVGGNEFDEGNGIYWSANNDSGCGSALSYIPEVAWNDTGKQNSAGTAIGLNASGGGRSVHFSKPSWQAGPGVTADGSRDVPDVALAASALHDPYLYCTTNSSGQGTCSDGTFRFASSDATANNTLTAAGGTSFSAPAFAAILTLVGERAVPGAGLGNANPMLYQLAASTTGAFHDITSGNNNVPTSSGNFIGYSAGPGYDPVTGLGSVDGNNLANAWAAATGNNGASSGGGSSGGSASCTSSGNLPSSSSSSSGGSGSSSSSSGGGSSGSGGAGGVWSPASLLVLAGLVGLRRQRRPA